MVPTSKQDGHVVQGKLHSAVNLFGGHSGRLKKSKHFRQPLDLVHPISGFFVLDQVRSWKFPKQFIKYGTNCLKPGIVVPKSSEFCMACAQDPVLVQSPLERPNQPLGLLGSFPLDWLIVTGLVNCSLGKLTFSNLLNPHVQHLDAG